MIKILVLTFIWAFSLNANTLLYEKIENLIGTQDFNTHQNLINLLFKDSDAYYINGDLKYIPLLQQLKKNGLLKLRLEQPKEITVEFHTNSDPIKSLKILNDTLKSLGYYYYFTNKTQFDGENGFTWSINLKTSYALDPLILSLELANNECKVSNIIKEENDNWKYSISTTNAIISDAIFVDANEKVVLNKPLKPYFIKINEAKTLKIISRNLNNWYPHIVFYDEHLNVLNIIKKDRVFHGLSIAIPETTQYIKITDLYTLINIKRGLSIITKE